MRLSCVILVLSGAMIGCNSNQPPAPRTAADAAMFAPAAMRIHPIFSEPADWTGDGKPDGIEALVEFTDQFGDPTKASGTAIFELFDYRAYSPDSRGMRLLNPWVGSLNTLAEQQARWNRTSRTYTFQLEYPQIGRQKNYVLSATFDTGSTRFFDRIILQMPTKEPELVPATPTPAPAAATQPAISRAATPPAAALP